MLLFGYSRCISGKKNENGIIYVPFWVCIFFAQNALTVMILCLTHQYCIEVNDTANWMLILQLKKYHGFQHFAQFLKFFYISCLLRCFSTQKKRKVQFSFWLGMHYSCVQCRMSYICVVVPLGYVYMSIYEFTYRYVYLFFYISVCLYLSIYLQKYRYVDRQT